MNRSVVVFGDPFNGLTLCGPFDDADEAVLWAQEQPQDEAWTIVQLHPPSGSDYFASPVVAESERDGMGNRLDGTGEL